MCHAFTTLSPFLITSYSMQNSQLLLLMLGTNRCCLNGQAASHISIASFADGGWQCLQVKTLVPVAFLQQRRLIAWPPGIRMTPLLDPALILCKAADSGNPQGLQGLQSIQPPAPPLTSLEVLKICSCRWWVPWPAPIAYSLLQGLTWAVKSLLCNVFRTANTAKAAEAKQDLLASSSQKLTGWHHGRSISV